MKFYISLDKGCHVDVNDTIIYETSELTSPIEHVILNKNQEANGYKMKPKGVYSEDLEILYFGYIQNIKTFSTYFSTNHTNTKKNNSETKVEYIYEVKNFIKSFSDFTNNPEYDDIAYNYDLLSWNFKNQNANFENITLKLEYFFDVGNKFANEPTHFSLPMNKTVYTNQDKKGNLKTIVKYETTNNFTLEFNKTFLAQAKVPLYFENCKNYKLNSLVFYTGVFFVLFFGFVAYWTAVLVMSEEKE